MRVFRRIKRLGAILEFGQPEAYIPAPYATTTVSILRDGRQVVDLTVAGSGQTWVVNPGDCADPADARSISASFGGDLREQRVLLGADGWFTDPAPEPLE
jgi:hypothetical protein